jgi:hypothetical protein
MGIRVWASTRRVDRVRVRAGQAVASSMPTPVTWIPVRAMPLCATVDRAMSACAVISAMSTIGAIRRKLVSDTPYRAKHIVNGTQVASVFVVTATATLICQWLIVATRKRARAQNVCITQSANSANTVPTDITAMQSCARAAGKITPHLGMFYTLCAQLHLQSSGYERHARRMRSCHRSMSVSTKCRRTVLRCLHHKSLEVGERSRMFSMRV